MLPDSAVPSRTVPWKSRITSLYRVALGLSAVDPVRISAAVASLPRFLSTLRTYRRYAGAHPFPLTWANLYPILSDFHEPAGAASGHYFHQDLWAARLIFTRRPKRHVDVASRIDGFVSHLLVFMPVDVIDIRPLESTVPGLHFVQSNAMTLDSFPDCGVESISSLHAVEHFGLGRYGDPVDPDACFVAMRSLARVLAPGGRLYFSVPVGVERVEFNAHRIFCPDTILRTLHDLDLVSFSAVDDSGRFHPSCDPSAFREARYACGLFEYTKK